MVIIEPKTDSESVPVLPSHFQRFPVSSAAFRVLKRPLHHRVPVHVLPSLFCILSGLLQRKHIVWIQRWICRNNEVQICSLDISSDSVPRVTALMGAFLLSGGTKGKRYSLPNSRIMIHQPLGGAQGGQTDIDIQANEMLHHKANLNGYLAYHTGQSLERINQDTDRDFFMSAKEAKDYGLIDGVILNPLKAFQPLAAAAEEK